MALHVPNVTSHILRVLSLDPDTMVSPLGENWTHWTYELPFSQMSGNTFVILVYVSPPVSGGKRQRYLWPSSVALHVPNSTSQILRVMSQDADTMVLPWGEKTHAVTQLLPFFELSGNTYVVVVYASPPLNLRLSPGERGRSKKEAWLTCGTRASSGARPCLGPTE